MHVQKRHFVYYSYALSTTIPIAITSNWIMLHSINDIASATSLRAPPQAEMMCKDPMQWGCHMALTVVILQQVGGCIFIPHHVRWILCSTHHQRKWGLFNHTVNSIRDGVGDQHNHHHHHCLCLCFIFCCWGHNSYPPGRDQEAIIKSWSAILVTMM